MDTIIIYVLKSVVASGLLTLYYWIFLRNRKFNTYNRFYLLFAMIISLLIPFFHFTLYKIGYPENELADNFLRVIGSTDPNQEVIGASPGYIITILVLSISFIFLFILAVKIEKILLTKKKNTNIPMKGFTMIETELDQAPFSFLNNLFWKKIIDLQSEEGQLIFNHELVHIRQKHTYDKLFAQVILCIFWMNPFYWIMQKELTLIHEFIADEKSIHDHDTSKLAKMLLQSYQGGRYLNPAHSFFHSPIKRRLLMITNSPGTPYSYLRRIFILPVTVLILFLFSFNISRAQTESTKKADSSQKKKMEDEHRANPFDQYHPQGYSPDSAEVREIVERILQNPPADRIYLVNGIKTPPEKIKKLKFEAMSDVLMLPPEEALKKFGVAGEKGVISFTLKRK